MSSRDPSSDEGRREEARNRDPHPDLAPLLSGQGRGPSPGAAVDQLLEEVGTETEPRPALSVEGMENRVAVVTGGASGIGRAITLEMARHGVDVAFNYLDEGSQEIREQAEEVAREAEALGVSCLARACDVRDPAAVNGFVQEVVDELGGIHILANNAGVARDRAFWRMTDREWHDVVQTNLTGTFYCLRAVAPHLRAQEWGKVVNIASVHGLRPEFGLANYAASKAGILALTRSAAVELGPSNVNVNAVAPGYIRTTRLTDGVPSEVLDRAREKSALARLGDPQDVADVVLFLCSEAARHITGAVIPVDGGYHI